uniref:Uncharacterized protein n=1 Tax=Cannabis sativa TaxID=3483 RepID=A0A803QDZ7_CANSA
MEILLKSCTVFAKRKNSEDPKSSKGPTATKVRPSPSPLASVLTSLPPALARTASVGRTNKTKARKKVFPLSNEHFMVFPDITFDHGVDAPPSEVVVPSRVKNVDSFSIEPSVVAKAKAKLGSSSSKATSATAGLLKLPMKPSRSKKNKLAPKRKLILGTSSSPSSSPSHAKKKSKAHPPSPSPSPSFFEFEPEEEESESKTDEFDESFPDHVDSELESEESESKDVAAILFQKQSVPIHQSLHHCLQRVKGKKLVTENISSPRMKGEKESEPLDKDEVLFEMVWPPNSIISITNLTFIKVISRQSKKIVAPSTAASYKASAPIPNTVEASSSKKSEPQSLVFALDDFPTEAIVLTTSASISAELSGVRASLNALTDRVMTLEGLQRSVLDAVQALAKAPEA